MENQSWKKVTHTQIDILYKHTTEWWTNATTVAEFVGLAAEDLAMPLEY